MILFHSSKMDSPKKYVPRFMLPPEERVYSPEREMNNIMGKMSPNNFDALVNCAKSIKILDEPERLKLNKADLEKIKPITSRLIINVMECDEKGPLIDVYSKFFYEMTVNPTIIRMGRAMMLMINEEISSIISSYVQKDDNGIEETLKLYSLIAFIGHLYRMNHKSITVDYMMMIIDQFCSLKYINIIGRILSQNLTKLLTEEAFKSKSDIYRKVVLDYVESDSRGAMYFILKDMLDVWK